MLCRQVLKADHRLDQRRTLRHLGKVSPKVFNDHAGVMSTDRAVVLHAALPHNKIANMGIVNLFVQSTGDAIKFPETGFSASRCFMNGAERNFAECLAETNIDMRLPPVPITAAPW